MNQEAATPEWKDPVFLFSFFFAMYSVVSPLPLDDSVERPEPMNSEYFICNEKQKYTKNG